MRHAVSAALRRCRRRSSVALPAVHDSDDGAAALLDVFSSPHGAVSKPAARGKKKRSRLAARLRSPAAAVPKAGAAAEATYFDAVAAAYSEPAPEQASQVEASGEAARGSLFDAIEEAASGCPEDTAAAEASAARLSGILSGALAGGSGSQGRGSLDTLSVAAEGLAQHGADEQLCAMVPTLFRAGNTLRTGDGVWTEFQMLEAKAGLAAGKLTYTKLLSEMVRQRHTASLLEVFERCRSRVLLPPKVYATVMKAYVKRRNEAKSMAVLQAFMLDHWAGRWQKPQSCEEVEAVMSDLVVLTVRLLSSKKVGDLSGFDTMLAFCKAGVRPTADCVASVVRSMGSLPMGLRLVQVMLQKEIAPTEQVYAALLRCCARRRNESEAAQILKLATSSGVANTEAVWYERINSAKYSAQSLRNVIHTMRKSGVVPTEKTYVAYIRGMAQQATRKGDAAVIHAERAFHEALLTCTPHPRQLYTELLYVYLKTRDKQAIQKLARAASRMQRKPPRFAKYLKHVSSQVQKPLPAAAGELGERARSM
eukprot:Rhum_TRINITY_DN13413_c0_g1::Rhum_TRINITY_DN13413_c0_g1_i1::g.59953::m.59953